MKIKITDSKDCNNCSSPCCYFRPNHQYFSPKVLDSELVKITKSGIEKKFFKSLGAKLFQINLIKSKLRPGWLICPFRREDKNVCLIYNRRPLDCKLWPINLAREAKTQTVFLTCCKKKYCPGLKKIQIVEIKQIIKILTQNKKIQSLAKNYTQYPWKWERNFSKNLKTVIPDS